MTSFQFWSASSYHNFHMLEIWFYIFCHSTSSCNVLSFVSVSKGVIIYQYLGHNWNFLEKIHLYHLFGSYTDPAKWCGCLHTLLFWTSVLFVGRGNCQCPAKWYGCLHGLLFWTFVSGCRTRQLQVWSWQRTNRKGKRPIPPLLPLQNTRGPSPRRRPMRKR